MYTYQYCYYYFYLFIDVSFDVVGHIGINTSYNRIRHSHLLVLVERGNSRTDHGFNREMLHEYEFEPRTSSS